METVAMDRGASQDEPPGDHATMSSLVNLRIDLYRKSIYIERKAVEPSAPVAADQTVKQVRNILTSRTLVTMRLILSGLFAVILGVPFAFKAFINSAMIS